MLCISTWKRCYSIVLWINIIRCQSCREAVDSKGGCHVARWQERLKLRDCHMAKLVFFLLSKTFWRLETLLLNFSLFLSFWPHDDTVATYLAFFYFFTIWQYCFFVPCLFGAYGNFTFKSLSVIMSIFITYGDLHPIPEVVWYPHFEVPYPISNGDNNF